MRKGPVQSTSFLSRYKAHRIARVQAPFFEGTSGNSPVLPDMQFNVTLEFMNFNNTLDIMEYNS